GTGPLTLSGTPLVSLTGSAYFTVSAQPSSSVIPAGGTRTFTITFTPAVSGTFVAIVSISNDDSDESLYDFVVQASALVSGKEIDILGNEISIVDGDITPSASDQTDFGLTDTTTAIAIPYNIYSAGSNTLTFSSTTVGISGPNASQFTATALLIVVSIAVLMTQVGLSPALGAFLAGVVLANSEYRHELESDIDPIAELIEKEFIKDEDNSVDKRKLQVDRFGYKSLHVVVSLNNERTTLKEYNRYKEFKCEIQIRSILQHAWAEIEHDLGYKGEISVPEPYKRSFNRLSALLETADIEFVRLKQELEQYENNLPNLIKSKTNIIDINSASLKLFMRSN
ncbi:MAG: choice-of-anchor D domain-containing protein, partial [Sphingobacteriaceae bacterium]